MTQNPLHQHGIPLFSIKPLKSTWCHIGRGEHGVAARAVSCTSQSCCVNTKKLKVNYKEKTAALPFSACCPCAVGTDRFTDPGCIGVRLIRPGVVGMSYEVTLRLSCFNFQSCTHSGSFGEGLPELLSDNDTRFTRYQTTAPPSPP